MNNDQISVAKECAAQSAAGKIHFGEVVARLMNAGIERYHTDYSRMENTYYTPEGGSCVVPMNHGTIPIATDFSAAEVEASVRRSQRGRNHVSRIYPPNHRCRMHWLFRTNYRQMRAIFRQKWRDPHGVVSRGEEGVNI